jgi:hypothetical protein
VRTTIVSVLLVVTALVLAPAAQAALEVRLSIGSSRPTKGDRIVVNLRPYYPYLREDGSCCRLVPVDIDYPFRVEARSPSGVVSRIRVVRDQSRLVWSGELLVRQAGLWEIRVTNWGPRYSTEAGGRPRIRFRVVAVTR